MQQETMIPNRIEILSPETARKIAAGEVVDRPSALVREFIDNAIDAGAKNITLDIEGGGAKMLSVIDDGIGMSREDLALCTKTHATSKIRSVEDLHYSLSLGFRGEALSAASAVSHLEIITSQDGREAFKLEVFPGMNGESISAAHHTRGTTVRTFGLFDAIPARKRFLKRDAAEAALCKQVLIDKALAFPEITFRFIQDGKLKLFFASVSTWKERFGTAVLEDSGENFLHEIKASGEGFSINTVFGGPEISRRDRRQQYIFANGRRIQEYSFLQALEYGLEGWFPNGTHPVGAVYIEIDPSLADFNIHPAKREARFKDSGAIHHAITSSLKSFMHHHGIGLGVSPVSKNSSYENSLGFNYHNLDIDVNQKNAHGNNQNFYRNKSNVEIAQVQQPDSSFYYEADRTSLMREFLDKKIDFIQAPRKLYPEETYAAENTHSYGETPSIKYCGRFFDLFILVEKEKTLYIIDQHAAHERILFNRFLEGPILKQELLVPIPFEAESEEDDAFLANRQEEFADLGLVIQKSGKNHWQIEALPVNWKLNDQETVEEILNLRISHEDIARRWIATLACRAAIKDGDYLDPGAALSLAEEALNLPNPHCPHGRPIWTEMSLESILKAVKRV